MDELIGKTLGQYQIIAKAGQGGMATVFRAYQPGLDRYVAIKVLSPDLARQAGFAERFQREALSVAKLTHPNILQVYDTGTDGPYNYIVMRYVENSQTLDDLILGGAPLNQLINYVVQVADALNYAHERGIIHRDIKPSNILIGGKWALLSDFGLVKLNKDDTNLTSTGLSMGTPAYMSPEQAAGREVDQRTDIYALGVILYKILSGTIPHHAPTPLAIAIKRSTEPVPLISTLNPHVPTKLEQVIQKALKIDPEERYPSTAQFASELEAMPLDIEATHVNLEAQTKVERPPGLVEATIASSVGAQHLEPTKEKQQPSRLIGLGVLLLILLGGGYFLLNSGSALSPSSTPQPIAADDTTEPSPTPVPTELAASPEPNTPTSTPTQTATNTPTAVIPQLMVLSDDVEIRTGPGEVYDVIGFLPAQVTAEIISRDKDSTWWRINTSLPENDGTGWVLADDSLISAENITGVPIAIAPATPTPLPSNTPTPTATATPTDTPEPTATATPTNTPSSTDTPDEQTPTRSPAPEGEFTLLTPNLAEEQVSTGMTTFEWQWSTPLAENQGFEVRVWREGQTPLGAHNAILDNQQGNIKALGDGTYRFELDISGASGVQNQSGDYNWAVSLVEISPDYKDLSIISDPSQLRYSAPGGGGDGDGDGGGGGGGGGGGFN